LIDNPASIADWGVRLLSGGGTPASNVTLDSVGWAGFWLKTDVSYLKTGFGMDAGGTEKSDSLDVTGDNQWHLYQWDLGDASYWNAWAGTGTNGVINKPVTIDAIWFYALNSAADGDTAIVYLDYVIFNPTGQVPVELASFNASVNGNVVDLKWITASETNNSGFEVERKTGNGSFEKIAFVEGKGTTTEVNGYSYSDAVNETGKFSYRLKQIDYDGSFEYSNVIEVEVIALPGKYGLAQNYPNPFNPSTVISYSIPVNAHVALSIFNLLGEKVTDLVNEFKESGTHSVNFNAAGLSSGTYIYTLNVNGNVISKKMTLVK
jgi:hypothetical protein